MVTKNKKTLDSSKKGEYSYIERIYNNMVHLWRILKANHPGLAINRV